MLFDRNGDGKFGVWEVLKHAGKEYFNEVARSAKKYDPTSLPSAVEQWVEPADGQPFQTKAGRNAYTPKVVSDLCYGGGGTGEGAASQKRPGSSAAGSAADETATLALSPASGCDKFHILPFPVEISYRCFTGCQKYF